MGFSEGTGEGEQKTFERSHADMVPQGWDFNLIA